ncbi:MAG: hypothetical protein H6853_08560 [Rhodospirillales bacterium]|nr:hypothetical protein [Alphaproteobacteria bacterium]USO03559.1 MAG: hypothetical protein H6853_08560 [Rhodospirillales bacterium]
MFTEQQKIFRPHYEPLKTAEVAQKAVDAALQMLRKTQSVVLAMGEDHISSAQNISQALALKALVANKEKVTLFMELPHNVLSWVLRRRGFQADHVAKLVKAAAVDNANGHMSARALLDSGRSSFGATLLLTSALYHDVKIVFADAAREYTDQFVLDLSDSTTREIMKDIGLEKDKIECAKPDGMEVRNRHMTGIIKRELKKTGGVGILATGFVHLHGVEEAPNVCLHKRSLSALFENACIPSVMVNMCSNVKFPPDYTAPEKTQRHMFLKPCFSAPLKTEIRACF